MFPWLIISWNFSSMQRPYLHSHAYGVLILLSLQLLLLLSLHYYCCCHITVATDKLHQVIYFPGVADLTNQLLKLINILWLPLCQINKFGFYFPRRLLRSPILVGHQQLAESRPWRWACWCRGRWQHEVLRVGPRTPPCCSKCSLGSASGRRTSGGRRLVRLGQRRRLLATFV